MNNKLAVEDAYVFNKTNLEATGGPYRYSKGSVVKLFKWLIR